MFAVLCDLIINVVTREMDRLDSRYPELCVIESKINYVHACMQQVKRLIVTSMDVV